MSQTSLHADNKPVAVSCVRGRDRLSYFHLIGLESSRNLIGDNVSQERNELFAGRDCHAPAWARNRMRTRAEVQANGKAPGALPGRTVIVGRPPAGCASFSQAPSFRLHPSPCPNPSPNPSRIHWTSPASFPA
ncbi:protein of unknown function (plasmid) [Cupriavidus taiwanensis]|uniref:Uncharacterized protein n=1 Tax=Cupriavidus taiwanensis TaxID=164546 RepID=A0A375IRT2_9BURK|nr:protein of unknown function [Cupriavidus taiwanensis]